MACLITPLKDLVSRLISRFRRVPKGQEQVVEPEYEDARMSYTRLQALEGPGYRQCYLEKLREDAETPPDESKERWFSEPQAVPIATVEAEAEKRRLKLMQAQHKMSYTRLEALVQQLTPEQRLHNDEESLRLGGKKFSPDLDKDAKARRVD
jgi:hypothetical protein